MGTIPGVVIGTVNAVDDPNGEGRIRVDFPWMGGSNKSYWAPVVTLMAGNGRGSWFMPEVGDLAIVAFDHGQIDHPFVLGFLWNGQDKPPETDVHKRLFKSVKGHSILFDDDDGDEKIEITTAGGLKITMDDTSNTITIHASTTVNVEAEKVNVKGTKINLGDSATQQAVLGMNLFTYLEELSLTLLNHVHTTQLALGVFPVVGAPGILPPAEPPLQTLLSTTVNVK